MERKVGPLVSIFTTTYNHERFIKACVESVLAQTYPRWEMIITDDGSTDRTPEILSQYKDERIRVIRQENLGVGRLKLMYERALAVARGELVTILSGDDAWPPNRLGKQVPYFADPRVVVCFGYGVVIDSKGKHLRTVPRGRVPEVLNRPIGSILQRLLVDNFLPSYTYLISRKALDSIGGFQQPSDVLGVDSPTLLQLSLKGEFRFVDSPMGYWRVHPGQSTNTQRLAQAKSDTAHALEFFLSLDPEMKTRTGWTEERLKQHLDQIVNNAFFESGRRLLRDGKLEEAMEQFQVALRRGSIQTKLKALLGIFCGKTGFDLERFTRLAEKFR